MSGRIGSCTFSTGCNQQINAVAKIENEDRCAVLGTVVNNGGRAIADAVVVLLKVNDRCSIPTPITHTFTDRYGQFVFGPLCDNRLYEVEIWVNNVKHAKICTECHRKGECLKGMDIDCKPMPPCKPDKPCDPCKPKDDCRED